jgi:glycosyltransferase involved in cell wall biosynthesis
MRVLALVTDGFGSCGGISKFNRDFLTALCSYPSTVEVLAIPRIALSSLGPLPKKLSYVTSGLRGRLNFVISTFKTALFNPKIDVIICGHIHFLPLVYLFSVWKRSPILLILHGIEAWQPSSNKLANALFCKVDVIISVSNFTQQRFLTWSKLRSSQEFILPNAVDLELFRPAQKNSGLLERYQLEGKVVLMTLGRLVSEERHKGFDEVLDLLPTLIQEIPNITYLIVGEGRDRPRLEAKAKFLDIAEYVQFIGFAPESEKADYYRLADVFVMPSRGEGFGIVLLEAMACGVPVVASKMDGGREAVRDGALGILVDPENPEHVKQGILEALQRPKGVVPEGLEYFSQQNFERRCHQIIDSLQLCRSNLH